MRKALLALCAVGVLMCACTSSKTSIPLPEHPRPDFERTEWINLNGYWDFGFKGADATDQKILVPFPWGSALSEVKDEGDTGWYKRQVTVPKSWEGKRVFLVVGASDWDTTVWLDGAEIGNHKGGYTPFECEFKDISYGKPQELVIKADDTYSDAHLYGKQGYGNARGIWQTVYLEARGENFIKTLHFYPDIDNSQVRVDVVLAAPAAEGEKFALDFKTGGQDGFTGEIGGLAEASYTIALNDQHLWDLDDPFLYEVTASLKGADGTIDEVNSYFGQRKVSAVQFPGAEWKYVALNNKPVYLQLCLDQSYHPEGYYTFPSDEFMKKEILISKNLGLNGNRIHIKVEVPRKLYWADKLGLLIMADTPNFWGQPVPEAREDWENCFRAQLERDFNHPSIFAWVNFNETWGLKDANGVYQKEVQEWVRDMHHLTKELDPTRLAEDNSACLRDHVETDINSWHSYCRGWVWNDEISLYDRETYPGSAFNYIGGNVQDDAPMINSECGNVWGYEGSAGDCDYTWDYHIMMDAFRRHPKVAGWLYTEHHDVINEWNGYVQYDRSPKFDGLDALVPGMSISDFHSLYYISPDRYLYTEPKAGETVSIPLYASFMTDKDPGSMVIGTELVGWDRMGEFKTFGKEGIPVDFQPFMSKTVAEAKVEMPKENGIYLLRIVLKDAKGGVLHRNFTTFGIKDGADPAPEKTRLVTFAPASFSSAEWSVKQSFVYDGLKVNGFGKGYFEYTVELPEDIGKPTSAELIFEASAKELFGKDVEGDDIKGDFMLGGGTADHCKSLNSYAMTDGKVWPSEVEVSVNGEVVGKQTLSDDPADHRGILSWAAQPDVPRIREAGSYGELVRVKIPADKLVKDGKAVIRLTVPEMKDGGGIAIYGKDFGRYPLDPTLVLKY